MQLQPYGCEGLKQKTKNYTSKLLFRVLHADVILHALSYTNTKLLKELRVSQNLTIGSAQYPLTLKFSGSESYQPYEE